METLIEIDEFEGKLRKLVLVQMENLSTLRHKTFKKYPRLDVISQITCLIDQLRNYSLFVSNKQQKKYINAVISLGFSRFQNQCFWNVNEKLKCKIIQCHMLIENLILTSWKVVSLCGLHKIQAIKLQNFVLAILNYNKLNSEIVANQYNVSKFINIFELLEMIAYERSHSLAKCIYSIVTSKYSFGECQKDLTEITTFISQEEHNICKLISVIKLTCNGNSEIDTNFLPENLNISAIYWDNLRKFVCEVFMTLALHITPKTEENLEEIYRVLDGKTWIAKVFDEIFVMLTIHSTSSTWDLSFCEALGCVSSKILTVSLPDGTSSTKAGHLLTLSANTIVSCLNKISDRNRTGTSDAYNLGLELLPRLSSNLKVALVWSEKRIQESLHSWNINNYLIIVHTDLKKLADVANSFCKLDFPSYEANNQISIKLQSLPGRFTKDLMKSACCRSQRAVQMYMPNGRFWKQNARLVGCPLECNDYMGEILSEIFEPVVAGAANVDGNVQIGVVSMVMKAFCQAFMDHILNNKMRFSLHGARMLHSDVGFLMNYVCHHPQMSEEAKQSVQNLEVVRRLKSAINILLKQRHPLTCRVIRSGKVSPGPEPDQCQDDQDSPDECFVPNAEEWSALRMMASGSRRLSFWCFAR